MYSLFLIFYQVYALFPFLNTNVWLRNTWDFVTARQQAKTHPESKKKLKTSLEYALKWSESQTLSASATTRNLQALNTSFYCPNIQKYK